MTEPPPRRRASTPVIWMLVTLVFVFLSVALAWKIGSDLWQGETTYGRGSSRSTATLSDGPLQYLGALILQVFLWLACCAYTAIRIRTWRKRREDPESYDKGLANIENAGSKTGNRIALILLAPFALILVVVITGLVMQFLRKLGLGG